MEEHRISKSIDESFSYEQNKGSVRSFGSDEFVPKTSVFLGGSVFLTIRDQKTTRIEFGQQSFSKRFDEIVLAPDGSIGIIADKIRRKLLL